MDKSKIDNIVFSDVDVKDSPDFSDAFIESADYDGREMTEEELDEINNDSQFVYESLLNQLY
jgi:hypothetical protein